MNNFTETLAMKITVFGATGMVGKYVVQQALAAGHHVIAFGRSVEQLIDKDNRLENLEAVKGYVFDEDDVYEAVKGSDAVISVLGGAFDGADKSRSLGIKNIVKQMERAGVKRVIALGGLGILQANEDELLIDQPGYPEIYKPVGNEHLQAFRFLEASHLDWTVVASPDIVDHDESGNFITNANYPPTPSLGKIYAGDLAAFMLDELNENQYLRTRVGISLKETV
jgi:uncharacterized protein